MPLDCFSPVSISSDQRTVISVVMEVSHLLRPRRLHLLISTFDRCRRVVMSHFVEENFEPMTAALEEEHLVLQFGHGPWGGVSQLLEVTPGNSQL